MIEAGSAVTSGPPAKTAAPGAAARSARAAAAIDERFHEYSERPTRSGRADAMRDASSAPARSSSPGSGRPDRGGPPSTSESSRPARAGLAATAAATHSAPKGKASGESQAGDEAMTSRIACPG